MHSSKKHLKYLLFIALAAGIGVSSASLFFSGAVEYGALLGNMAAAGQAALPAPSEVSIATPPPPAPPAEATLSFVGDMMFDRSVKKSVDKNFGGDYGRLFANVSSLAGADILFGNLEGPVSVGGKQSGSVYSFRFSPAALDAVSKAGFDVLNIANNHIGDWGADAFADTLDSISGEGLQYTGGGWNKTEAEAPTIVEKNGIKIGYLGFTDVGPAWLAAGDNAPGILLASDPDFDQIVKEAASQVDDLVVSFHFGEEYKKYTARQTKLAHEAIDDGAKIVVGSHPHVIQDTEEYNGGLIAYSLGNFIFDQKFSKETMQGLLLEATVTKDGLKSYDKKLIQLNDSYQPEAPADFSN